MPKHCPRCIKTNPTVYTDDEEKCKSCSGPLKFTEINNTVDCIHEEVFHDTNPPEEHSQVQQSITDNVQCIMKTISEHPTLKQLLIVFDIEPNNRECVILQFYTVVREKLWSETKAICLHIMKNDLFESEIYYCPFLSLKRISISLDNIVNEFHIITGCIRIPSSFIRTNCLAFNYEYIFYFDDDKPEHENLCHSNSKPYYRYFYEGIKYSERYVNDPIKRFDTMIFRVERNCFNSLKTDSDMDICRRRLISLIAFLTMQMGKFKYTIESKTLDLFLEEFVIRSENLVSIQIRPKGGSACVNWDSDKKIAKTDLVHKYMKFLSQKPSDYSLEEKTFLVYLTIILFQKYSMQPEEIYSIIADLLNAIFDPSVSSQEFVFDFRCKDLLCDGMSRLIQSGPPKTKHLCYFQLITLYHRLFVSQDQHFENLCTLDYSKSEFWGFPKEFKFCSKLSFSDDCVRNAFKLVRYDPILSYSILYCCPTSKFDLICQMYNSYPKCISLQGILSLLLFHQQENNKNFMRTLIRFLINQLSSRVHEYVKDIDIQCVFHLLLNFSSKISVKNLLKSDYELITDLFSHLYICLKELGIVETNEFLGVFKFVQRWYEANMVKLNERNLQNEMTFWDKTILYLLPDDWSQWVTNYLKERLKHKDFDALFNDLFVLVQTKSKSAKLKTIFTKEILNRLKKSDSRKRDLLMRKLKSLSSKDFKNVTDVFCSILLHEEEQFCSNESRHLLEWSSWELYFRIATMDDVMVGMNPNAKAIIDRALQELTNTINSIRKHEVTTTESDYYSKKQSLILTLVGESSSLKPYLNEITGEMEYCKLAASWIKDQLEQLSHLQSMFSKIPTFTHSIVGGFLDIYPKSKSTIAQSVSLVEGKFCFTNFPEISELVHSTFFHLMSRSAQYFKDSCIFPYIFTDLFKSSQCRTQEILDFSKLFEEVWKPASEAVEDILESCKLNTILISQIQLYFVHKHDCRSLKQEFDLLSKGSHKVLSTSLRNISEFSDCSNKIESYFALQPLSQTAAIFVELKKAYSIESDFSLMESLQNVQSLQDRPISLINEEFVQLSTKLRGFTPENLTVLDTILKNMDLILWIKSRLALDQLKNFVEIALTTSGEQSIETYYFSSVCTNLEAIIFPITKQTTHNFLILQFQKVFSIVQSNKDILVQLTHLSKYTKFLEELLQSQGSLEETTIKQINRIVSSGIFTLSTQNSFNLVVGERKYNMEQLYYLRSKLNLIVVNSENKVREQFKQLDNLTGCQVDAAKFNNLCDLLSDLASVIKDLVDKGDIAYSDYDFSCKLQEAEKVEIEINAARLALAKRTADIEKARREYYFLNYYTISQIVLLQKGLLSFIDNSDVNCQEQMCHLLCLLPLDFDKQNIQPALEKARIIASNNENVLPQSKPFQSGASSLRYNFVGADSLRTCSSEKFTTEDESEVIPETFSPIEKQVAEELLDKKLFSIHLIISGINALRNTGVEIGAQSLSRWCHKNKGKSSDTRIRDRNSLELSRTTPQYVPQTVSKFVGTDRLDIFQLGEFLKAFYYSNRQLLKERNFHNLFKLREPNLVLVPSYLIYEFIISIYLLSPELPLPYYGEVLICSEHTCIEEIDIFWRRTLFRTDYNHYCIFCLVTIEKLQYQVAEQAVALLWKLFQLETNSSYKLIVICSEDEENRSYMAAALENYRRPNHITTISSLSTIDSYLQIKFSQSCIHSKRKSTSLIDKDQSRVRLVVSDNVGAGKSFYINSLKSDLLNKKIVNEDELGQATVIVVMHGKLASEEHITEQLLEKGVYHVKHGILFHVDIASTLQIGLEPILFKLLVLGGVCKRSGEFWHCRLNDYYIIETTVNPQNKQLGNFTKFFPNIQCFQPRLAMAENDQPKDKSYLTKEDFRRTFAYLKESNANINMDNFVFDNSKYPEVQPNEMLSILLDHCGIRDPSWAEINNFVTFLSKQLSDCDNSDYCSAELMKCWVGFKSFVLRFLILMSRDFATPSLRGEVEKTAVDTLQTHQIIDNRRWENSPHPYIFFNQDRHTMTFLGFIISNQGHLMDSIVPTAVIKRNIIRRGLMKELKDNSVNLCEDFQKLKRDEKFNKFSKVMGLKELTDPDPGYVLTLDNIRKILAIYMRFRCNIPVVIMGETGCGKTRLIQFMCSLHAQQTGATNMLILKVHGGTTERDVMRKVEEVEKLARHNFHDHNIDTILFFDEANTSPVIGLIKEIMCDRRMNGRHISSDIRLQFIAACNPYRRHTKEMLHKLSTAGLGFFTKSTDTTDRLGDIPLRELVYRVMELPASMRPLVWDFGQLSNDIEKTYTREIVAKHLKSRGCLITADDCLISAISQVLSSAQSYMRERDDECSFVSLRDVERAMRAMSWFYKMLENLFPSSLRAKPQMSDVTYSLILSLAVCYRARLKQRNDFDTKISKDFRHPLSLIIDHSVIELEVNKCQNYILCEMTVDEHIAKNRALRENVFMMFVCIELRIPLFVIGKPGSSKSLAKTIISHNMQGNKCQDNSVLRNFSEVHIMSYQCSQLSTAEGISVVFKDCKTMQKNTGSNKFVSCVVLDEVGLAEDSPLMPLKVLHSLLEDCNYESNERDEYISDHEITVLNTNLVNQVAFIGISNWSLDPAKMNRGIMVSRDDPDHEELLLSAKEICSSSTTVDAKLQSVDSYISILATTYLKLLETANSSREYYGLRDFYSLIKMMVSLCRVHDVNLTSSILNHAVLRNFGGSDNQPFEDLMQSVNLPERIPPNLDNTPLGLIRANLVSSSTSFYGETRYLLLLTKNYAALNILMKLSFMWPEERLDKVRVLFGSSFPKDQDYSTACRNINKIKVCMESGKTVILLHLELLYESLYDTLNQYYLKIYDQRFVDLGLGTHRIKCRVHNDFKLIVIADEDSVYKRFPTPLINRLEKHCLNMKTVLSNEGLKIAEQLAQWAQNFKTLEKGKLVGFERIRNFDIGDCFIGYHQDTPSSIVFQVMKRIYPNNTEHGVEVDQSSVLSECMSILLQMATTDAVLRVKNSVIAEQSDRILQEYLSFNLFSLEEYLKHNITKYISVDGIVTHYTLATTHCRHMTERDVVQLNERFSKFTDQNVEISSLFLQHFQTEQQYIIEVQRFLKSFSRDQETIKSSKRILLIQCERGAFIEKLITCARYKIVDELKEWKNMTKIELHNKEEQGYQYHVYVIFLVSLFKEAHGSEFSSYCGGEWSTVHIDDICTVDYEELPSLSVLIGKEFYEILFGECEGEQVLERKFWKKRIEQCIQPACSRLKDCNGSEKRTLLRMKQFIHLQEKFDDIFQSLCQKLKEQLKYSITLNCDSCDWIQLIANCRDSLQSSGTFRKSVNLYINSIVTPILTELIAYMDRNGNLELLNTEKNTGYLQDIWRDIFKDEDMYRIHSWTPSHPRMRVPVLSDGLGRKFFQVQFPFSFFIQGDTTILWKEFIENNNLEQRSQLCWYQWEQYFFDSRLGRLIWNLKLKDPQENFQLNICYLLDFIQMRCFPKTQEQCNVYESVMLSWIEKLPLSDEERGTDNPNRELTIPKIHYAYEESKQLLDILQQSFLLEESLGNTIYIQVKKDPKSCIEVILLDESIILCNRFQKQISSREEAVKCVSKITRWSSVVDKTLSLYKQNCKDYQEHLHITFRDKWNNIRIIHMFIYYFCLGVNNDAYKNSNITLILTMFNGSSDFTTSETINDILSILSNFVKEPRGSVGLCATKCFIKILTDIAFKCLPKNDGHLQLDYVTINEENIQEVVEDVHNDVLDIFKREEVYLFLSFKTYILQLMIKYRKDVFKEIFSNHYLKPQLTTSKQLFTIFTHSLEDSLHARNICDNIEEKTVLTAVPVDICENVPFSFELLDKIANLRFCGMFMSQRIIEHLRSETHSTDNFNDLCDFCLTEGNRQFHIFLLKQIYHNLGSDMLTMITDSNCQWLLPTPDPANTSYSYAPDYFLIYGDTYKMLKEAVKEACENKDTTQLLQKITDNTEIQKDIEMILLYSVFNIISDSIKDGEHEDFEVLSDLFKTHLCNINENLQQIVMKIISRNDNNCFKHSHDSKNEKIALAGLIYHMAILLASDALPKIFAPIHLIYQNPSALKDMLFPTVVSDTLLLSKCMQRVEAGQWKLCNNGHPYFVKSCQQTPCRICSECGTPLGEEDQKASTANNTQLHGYILDDIDCLGILFHSRSLSPASVSIIRALMDITFIWSSCFGRTTNDNLFTLVIGGPKNPEGIPDFFYQHLHRVISDLARQKNVNFDEATLILHLILKSLTQAAEEQCSIDTNLATNELRSTWEREFELQFIQPFINCPTKVDQNERESILVEDMIAKNEIFAVVHEREELTNDLSSCLWHYKSSVSLDDFCQKFSTTNTRVRTSCPFLEMFLKEERSIFFVRYLPDIVQLQRRMIEVYNHRLNKQEARKCTIGDFLGRIEDPRLLEELTRLVNVLFEVWNRIGNTVKKCGRLQIDHIYLSILNEDNSLSYMLASSTGEGLLITSLTDYLVLIHNSIVHEYGNILKESFIERIPLDELNPSHVIVYEEHLQSLLLVHSHYSLTQVQERQLCYDFEGVEQIMEEFIRNKPLILAQHLRFEYVREPHNLDVFEQVRQKVKQRPLKKTLLRPIREELNSPEVINDVLIVLDVVIGFLIGTGGHPEQTLSSYIHDTLKYPTDMHGINPLGIQCAEEVLLTHVLSFWNFLSVEQARNLSILGQFPFSSLKPEYHSNVSDEVKRNLKDSCNHYSVEDVLKYLHQFIQFYLREREELDLNMRLKDCIGIYATEFKLEIPVGYSEYFPETIKLDQCIAAWMVLAQQEYSIS